MPLIKFTDKGLYIPLADVYIDPWKPVNKAFITHGHADHSKYGMKQYVATHAAVPVIKYRLGSHNNISGVDYGESISINGVKFSFHPAGHITGSAQIRVEHKGEIWVASGDYKVTNDGFSEPFEPVRCHTFITESTFGLPVFRWKPQGETISEINKWWQFNKDNGRVSIIASYSLGKAQRVINSVDHSIGKIYTHSAVENINEVLRNQGLHIADTIRVEKSQSFGDYAGSLVIAPPPSLNSSWSDKFKDYSSGVASGWMAFRVARKRRPSDRGFVFSDHADWDGLLTAVKETECERVFVTHGYQNAFSKYLRSIGYDAGVVDTEYSGEEADIATENKEV